MTDVTAAPVSGKSWADVADTALHYAAAGVLVGAIGLFAYWGKISADVFTNLCVAGLAGLGVYKGAVK